MEAQIFQKLHPREYINRFLGHGVRADGRLTPNTFRAASLRSGSISSAVGSAMLKLGRTTVVAGVTARLEAPSVQTSDMGSIDLFVEILPIAKSTARTKNTTEYAAAVAQLVRTFLLPHVNLRALCVEQDVLAWRLCVTVYAVDHDGNFEDAALLACVSALQNVRLPAVSMLDREEEGEDEEMMERNGSDVIACVSEERTVPLEMDGFPVPVSFGLLEEHLLADPTLEEEIVADGKLTLLYKPNGELRAVHKHGGPALPQKSVQKCIGSGRSRVKELVQLLEDAAAR